MIKMYKHTVKVIKVIKTDDGSEKRIECSNSEKTNPDHETELMWCKKVFEKAVRELPQFESRGPFFYDRQATVYAFKPIEEVENFVFPNAVPESTGHEAIFSLSTSTKLSDAEVKKEIKEGFLSSRSKINLNIILSSSSSVTIIIDVKNGDKQEPTETHSSSTSKDSICVVCMEAPVNAVVYKCGHMCLCFECGKRVLIERKICPICRGPVKDVIKTFNC